MKVPEGGYSRNAAEGGHSPKRIAALFAATPKPKLFQWVPGYHGWLFDSPQGRASRFHRAWLQKNL
ncbi:MAG: hypothetical protein NTX16_11870 [Actinobacteria bacterium]|nr:hypothetical protein [Actinomycetota bacterium]